jgi:hypothetical protein
MIYKLYSTDIINPQNPNAAMTIDISPQVSFLFNPENADYETFKTSINDETAQLETADGVLMTPEEAKAYVATLP